MATKHEHAGFPIPHPATLPLIGNLRDLDRHAPAQSFMRLAREYGPIYRLELPGRSLVILSSRELVNEVCDERRFDKLIGRSLSKVREFSGDGLFTAWTHESNWRKAHNILMPNFGPEAMQGYFPQMLDITDQLLGKWARLNADDVIDVPDDMTRLTLDTIGLCGFDFRFNSFYRDHAHPFVDAMTRTLGEALLRANRLAVHESLLFGAHSRYARDIAYMNEQVDRLIQARRSDPEALTTKHDLLNHMLTGIDKQTGERLDDVNIRYQILTFLIAGHETTSGLLSFALYFLLKHPDALAKAYEEVDRVLDAESPPSLAAVRRLVYIQQVLKESLRLWPTAPAFSLYPLNDELLCGKYPIRKGENLVVLLPMLHRDPAVWGDTAEIFDPDRFLPDRERALPPNAYKPFGNGQRSCIGQQFAMQEATLVLGMILRRFEPIDHRDYRLRVKETLTLKPDGFTIKVRPRARKGSPGHRPSPTVPGGDHPKVDAGPGLRVGHNTPLLVLYGSNLGTAERTANRIAEDARVNGFSVTVAPLDEYAGRLPTASITVVVSASYNGSPPDNAIRFCEWLRTAAPVADALAKVRYAVFGCGDQNWIATYQAIPKLIDEQLAARGAVRICPRGEGNMADDFDGQFRTWCLEFWKRTAAAVGLTVRGDVPRVRNVIRVEPFAPRSDALNATAFGAVPMELTVNRELQCREGACPSDRSTRHIELALPEGVTYQTGDHLGVVPRNRIALVRRVLSRFRLDGEMQVVLRRDGPGSSHLPLDAPVRLADLFAGSVEFQEAATRDHLAILAERTTCPVEKARLLALSGAGNDSNSRYRDEILAKRVSVLDLLEECPACELPFDEYLGMLPPLRPRYYSISSSPLVHAQTASITAAVVRSPARSGRGVYEGIASNYLAELPVGAKIQGFIRGPGSPFRPPDDPLRSMVMIGAGTGLAPFRGFLQERAALRNQGGEVGKSLLIFGCRRPDQDFLYEAELRRYEADGLVRLVTAFSRQEGQSRCYVQHAVATHGDELWELLSREASVYVCGDATRMAPAVREAFRDLHRAKTGLDGAHGAAWLNDLLASHRYVEDVWASG